MATHLGVIDEDSINQMSFIFFDQVLEELGHKLTYDAIVNYAGNSFCEKSWEMITNNNPFHLNTDKKAGSAQAMNAQASFFNGANIKVRQKDKGE